MKRSAILVGVTLFLAACASSSSGPRKITVMHADDLADNPTAQINPDDTVVCENVLVAGSHIPQRVCQTARDSEVNRQQTQNNLAGKTPGFQIAR